MPHQDSVLFEQILMMFKSLLPTPQDFPLPPPPSWYQHAAMAICTLSIFLPPGPIRLSTGLILLALIFHLTFWTYPPTFSEYTAASACMATLFAWLDFIAFHQLESDFWKIGVNERGDVVEERAPEGGWAKLKWSTSFWLGYRKIGWNIQISSIPPAVPSSYPRGRFLKEMLFKIIKMTTGMDITCLVCRLLAHSRRSPNFFDEPLLVQVLSGWATAAGCYFSLSLIYHVAAFFSALLSLTPPTSWPPINGSFRENFFSVRKTWGRLWHQFVRRYCTSAGLAVTRLFLFQKGSFASRYTQLWVGFMVGAFIHFAPAVRWVDGGFWQAVAFLCQPIAIMLEDFVILGGKRIGLRDNSWTRGIGYLWVMVWFSYSLRFWAATIPLEFAEGDELPSLARFMIKKFGIQSIYGIEY